MIAIGVVFRSFLLRFETRFPVIHLRQGRSVVFGGLVLGGLAAAWLSWGVLFSSNPVRGETSVAAADAVEAALAEAEEKIIPRQDQQLPETTKQRRASREVQARWERQRESLRTPDPFGPRPGLLEKPRDFDLESYEANPETYLSRAVFARAFETTEREFVTESERSRQKSETLKPVGDTFFELKTGETATLKVRTAPGAPVTFSSYDLGLFENNLNTITVPANRQGVAEAEYRATPGVYDDVRIIAASPVRLGQVEFDVLVVPVVSGG